MIRLFGLPKVSEPVPDPVNPTWEIRDYPTGTLLHTADNYWDADNWRLLNHQASVIVPHWAQETDDAVS